MKKKKKKNAPVRKERLVKQSTIAQRLSSYIISAMKINDKFKREKKFDDWEKKRNKDAALIRAANKKKNKKKMESLLDQW